MHLSGLKSCLLGYGLGSTGSWGLFNCCAIKWTNTVIRLEVCLYQGTDQTGDRLRAISEVLLARFCWAGLGFAVEYPLSCWHLGLGRWSRMACVAPASCIGALLCEILQLSLGKPLKRCCPWEGAGTPWCWERWCGARRVRGSHGLALPWSHFGRAAATLHLFLFRNPGFLCYTPVWKSVCVFSPVPYGTVVIV